MLCYIFLNRRFQHIEEHKTYSLISNSQNLIHYFSGYTTYNNSFLQFIFQAQDFDIIQDWRRTTVKKHHHTPARLSSPTINTRASPQKYYYDLNKNRPQIKPQKKPFKMASAEKDLILELCIIRGL